MNPIHDPRHPIWDFGRFVVVIGAAAIILWANASDFDITEGKSLALLAAAMGGWNGVERLLLSKSSSKQTEPNKLPQEE